VCAKELATIFAHFAQETGANDPSGGATGGVTEKWRQGLYWLTEIYCSPGGGGAGSVGCNYFSTGWSATAFPRPNTTVQYYGRGAKQLSWNYNYGPFSKVMYGDKSVLLNNPEKVADEGWLAIASAFWFYTTP